MERLGGWAEERLAGVTALVRPLLPVAARLLVVATFIEDGIRIVSQWKTQTNFMVHSQGLSSTTALAFLSFNVAAQLLGSALVVARIRVDVAVALLTAVLIAQAVAYGLATDPGFVFRALSVFGGLVLLLSEFWSAAATAAARKTALSGLPQLDRGDRAAYLLVAGRVLLVGLVVSLLIAGDLTPARIVLGAVGGLLCLMVIIGFKAKTTALVLLVVLSALNVALNGFWTYSSDSTKRDYAQYDFFQTLSVVGGFLLLVNLGPGGLSIDEQKKRY